MLTKMMQICGDDVTVLACYCCHHNAATNNVHIIIIIILLLIDNLYSGWLLIKSNSNIC